MGVLNRIKPSAQLQSGGKLTFTGGHLALHTTTSAGSGRSVKWGKWRMQASYKVLCGQDLHLGARTSLERGWLFLERLGQRRRGCFCRRGSAKSFPTAGCFQGTETWRGNNNNKNNETWRGETGRTQD